MRGAVISMGLAIAFATAAADSARNHAQAQTQTQDCSAIVRDMGEQTRLGELARTRAQLLREGVYRADALHRGLIFREPSYTLENLTAGIQNTRSDFYFNTDTPRGIMLGIHARTLDALRDVLAGNELLGMLGGGQGTFGTVLPVMDQFNAEAATADQDAARYEQAAAALGRSLGDCMAALAADAAARLQNPGFTLSAGPTAGSTQRPIAPEGMTELCNLTGGPRAGETINMSLEHGFPVYVPLGDVCYDNRPDTSIGLAVAQ